jgi:acetyl-CoA C-acetyltransferase
MLIPPLRLLHICPTSVGACAIILAPEAVAKKISPNPAWVVDWVTVHAAMTPILGHQGIYLTCGPLGPLWAWAVEKSATLLYKRNGITNPRKELDVIEMYNMSTWHEAEWYERIHICERNGSGKLIEKSTVFINGELPVNPSGGVVSTNAIGASAMLRVAEAAIQVRGEGDARQVDGVETALAISAGGDTYSAAILLKKHL